MLAVFSNSPHDQIEAQYAKAGIVEEKIWVTYIKEEHR